jgi:hypothetical protein
VWINGQVLVVDDNSSSEDRTQMQTLFPSFRYIYKDTVTQRGHAASMNIIMKEAVLFSDKHKASDPGATSYLIYLEDDWKLLNRPPLYQPLTKVIDKLEEISFRERAQEFSSGQKKPNSFEYLIMMAVGILENHYGCNGDQIVIDQVLFNEQGSRGCAVADGRTCGVDIIGHGGWPRSTVIMDVEGLYNRFHQKNSNRNPSSKANPVSFPYSLHEFGIVGMPHAHGDRNHDFANWPGLSLNPGVWAIDRIYSQLSCVLQHCDATGDADGQVCKIFDEADILFEQRWSVSAHAAQLHMAYLPALVFEHIGTEQSAYELNNYKRPWD